MELSLINLAQEVATYLLQHSQQLVTAESCTGGGLGYLLTELPGSSQWYERGYITYSNAAKMELLGVKKSTLAQFGAVSAETAREMAEGALAHSHAQISIAITGTAGPDGGTETKPVGTVWIGWAMRAKPTFVEGYHFAGDRHMIRQATLHKALAHLLILLGKPKG